MLAPGTPAGQGRETRAPRDPRPWGLSDGPPAGCATPRWAPRGVVVATDPTPGSAAPPPC